MHKIYIDIIKSKCVFSNGELAESYDRNLKLEVQLSRANDGVPSDAERMDAPENRDTRDDKRLRAT